MKKSQSFFGGATILISATLLVKIIGALYKIPLTNLLGGTGMGYYMSAYGLFNPIYAMSVAGFPIAISKLVSKGRAEDKEFYAFGILKSGVKLFFVIGLILSVVMVVFAKNFAIMVENYEAYYCIIAIAPAIAFAAASAAFRGYYEGQNNMLPTGISQAVEAAAKLVIGITLVIICTDITKGTAPDALMRAGELIGLYPNDFKTNLPIIAAAGITGVTLGSLFSLLFLGITTFFRPRQQAPVNARPTKKIGTSILQLAVPVCLGALMINITSIVDLMTIMNGLGKITSSNLAILNQSHHYAIPQNISPAEIPSFLYGTYTGLAITIFNIVPSITIALGTAALPIISGLNSARKKRELRMAVNSIVKITGMFTLPAGIGIAVLSEPILRFFFSSNPAEVMVAASLLKILGFAVIFVGFVSPITSILQGIGAVYVPAKLMAIGGITKLLLNYFLISVPQVNIKAAPFSTLACYTIIVIGGLYCIENRLSINMNVVGLLYKPALAAVLCGATAYFSYNWIDSFISSKLVLLIAIALGGIVYVMTILLLRTITREDLSLFKNGEKFSKMLEIKGYLG